jgi:hypothetical protein
MGPHSPSGSGSRKNPPCGGERGQRWRDFPQMGGGSGEAFPTEKKSPLPS